MPKLWSGTIEAHRQQVHSAVVAATATLVARHGIRGVTMSRIAQDAGIGRATLYKYFPDVESILLAWHDEHVTEHLDHLRTLRSSESRPKKRLASALESLAEASQEAEKRTRGTNIAALLHASDHVTTADAELQRLLLELIQDAIQDGSVRDDIPAEELATYCVNAALGARHLPSKAAVTRAIQLTMASLRP